MGKVLVAALSVVLVAGCSSTGPDDDASSGRQSSGADTDLTQLEDGTVIPEWAGAPLNPFDLRAGQCFNEASWVDLEQDRRISVTAAIDCSQPHDKEVYFEAEFPAPNGAPFPGDDAMTDWSTEQCYEAFRDFVGQEYELSTFGIDFLHPTQETFEHPIGRHRRVSCYLYDTSGEKKVESARGSGL